MDQTAICPRFEKAITLISQRWTALIIYQLMSGTQRFCTMQSTIGISGKVLSERLKELEHHGVVKRNVIPDTPVVIEYSLTEKGASLAPMLRELESWSQQWIEVEEG